MSELRFIGDGRGGGNGGSADALRASLGGLSLWLCVVAA